MKPNDPIGYLKATITIREASSGREVTYQDKFPYWDLFEGKPNTSAMDYVWRDGNFSCACNRKIFFYRELEHRDLEDEETPCGLSQHYPVKIVLEDGTVILNDFDLDLI